MRQKITSNNLLQSVSINASLSDFDNIVSVRALPNLLQVHHRLIGIQDPAI